MNNVTIGGNAGKIWKILNERKTAQSYDELQKSSSLNDFELFTALGWLAREEKIVFTEKEGKLYYSLFDMFYF